MKFGIMFDTHIDKWELIRYAEELGHGSFSFAIFGVDSETGAVETLLQKLDDARRASDGVFVEIEAQLVGASGGGRGVGRHFENGFAGPDGTFGLGVRARACSACFRADTWFSH